MTPTLNVEKDVVKKKIKIYIGQFWREIKRTKSHFRDGLDDIYVRKWFGLKSFMFLKDKNHQRTIFEAWVKVSSFGR